MAASKSLEPALCLLRHVFGAGGFLVGSTGIIVSPSFFAILNCSSTLYWSCDVLPALVLEDFPKAFIEAPTDCRVILVESREGVSDFFVCFCIVKPFKKSRNL